MVDEFEKVALDCLSNSFLRKAGLVVIDEVENLSMPILLMDIGFGQFCLVLKKSSLLLIRLGLT